MTSRSCISHYAVMVAGLQMQTTYIWSTCQNLSTTVKLLDYCDLMAKTFCRTVQKFVTFLRVLFHYLNHEMEKTWLTLVHMVLQRCQQVSSVLSCQWPVSCWVASTHHTLACSERPSVEPVPHCRHQSPAPVTDEKCRKFGSKTGPVNIHFTMSCMKR